MQVQSQYPIVFSCFVDFFQKVSFEKYFEADYNQNLKNLIFFVFALYNFRLLCPDYNV